MWRCTACTPKASTASQALPTAHGSYDRHCRQVGVGGRWTPGRGRGLRHCPPACIHLPPPPPGLPADPAAVKLENFPIHAITGVLKQWLRELPEPLMTFAQYGDFLRAVGESHSSSREGRRMATVGVGATSAHCGQSGRHS